MAASIGTQSGAGKRAIVSTKAKDTETYAPAVLVAIHARTEADGPDAKQFGAQDLVDLGGVFEAFTAFPDARWVFYVGRRPSAGEAPQVVTFDGPKNAAAALENGCKGAGKVSEPSGHKWCSSVLPAQVPTP